MEERVINKKYLYKNKDGNVLGHVHRLESHSSDMGISKKSKQTIPYFNDGGTKKGLPDDLQADHYLYGLDTIQDLNEVVYIVEGEKCAHALQTLGFQAVTSIGGFGRIKKIDFSPLEGVRRIVLLPDNDEAGDKFMHVIYRRMRKMNSKPEISVVTLPELPEKGDICDYLAKMPDLEGWNELDSLEDHPNREAVAKHIREAFDSFADDVPENWKFLRTKGNLKSIDAKSFGGLKIPERKALLHPLFMEGSINMVYAARGLGKTFFCLSCGVAMANGKSFLKYDCEEKCKVLYLDGEMQAPLMQQRLKMLSDELSEDFHILTPDFQEVDVIPDLSTVQGQELVDDLIERTGVNMIFIDNISTFMRTGNENDAESWSTVQPWLVKHRSKGRSFTLVHHSNKAGEQRGSNKKEDIMDVVVHLDRPDDYVQGEDCTRLLIKLTKARHIFGEDAQDVEAELYTANGKAEWKWTVAESSYDKVVALLKDGNLTQQEIAEDVKVSKGTVSKWKRKAKTEGLL